MTWAWRKRRRSVKSDIFIQLASRLVAESATGAGAYTANSTYDLNPAMRRERS